MWFRFLEPSNRSTDGQGRSRLRARLGWPSAYTPRGSTFPGRPGRELQEDAIEQEVDFWTADPDEERGHTDG